MRQSDLAPLLVGKKRVLAGKDPDPRDKDSDDYKEWQSEVASTIQRLKQRAARGAKAYAQLCGECLTSGRYKDGTQVTEKRWLILPENVSDLEDAARSTGPQPAS